MPTWWLIVIAALVLLLLFALWLRQRGKAREAFEEEGDGQDVIAVVADSEIAPVAQRPDRAAASPAEPVGFRSRPAPAVQWSDMLDIRFEPKAVRISLVYVALSYRMTITNRASQPIGPLRIRADMTSAHSSRPTGEQLLIDTARAPTVQILDAIAGGAAITFEGQLTLDLSKVHQISNGEHAIFLPLVRFLIRREGRGGECTRAFALGQAAGAGGDRMAALRFDVGARIASQLESREVDLQRWLSPVGMLKAS